MGPSTRGGHRRPAYDHDEPRTLTEQEVRELIKESERRVLRGFPNNDPDAHRIKHDIQEKDDESVRKIKWSLVERLVMGVLTFLIGVFAAGLLPYVLKLGH